MTEEQLREPETVMRIAAMNQGYGTCYKCGLPWNHCKHKLLRFSKELSVFAMCCYCWDHSTVEERIHHHRSLWYEWTRWPYPIKMTLEEIDDAVRAESLENDVKNEALKN